MSLRKLLQASSDIITLQQRVTDLQVENARLRRENGKLRLLVDLRRQAAEFDLSADDRPALLRPQA
jgi:hypothetical protein